MRSRSFVKFLGCAAALFAQQGIAFAELKSAETARVQSDVRAITRAVYTGDAKTVLRYTHTKVLDQMGGAETAERMLGEVFSIFKAAETELESQSFPSAPVFLKGRQHEFVIVPTLTKMKVAGQSVESLHYQFGARPAAGGRWLYIDGARIDASNVRKFFPDFPKDYEFPKKSLSK
jgi:hypothetical protein